MTRYRIAQAQSRRVGIYDEYGRCVELVHSGTSEAAIAERIESGEAAGDFLPGEVESQRVYDTSTKSWSAVDWPVDN